MEEASPVETKKKKPDNPSGQHDLLNLDSKNRKSLEIRSLQFPQTNRSTTVQRTCSQDLLGDSKTKKSRDSRSIMPPPIEESDEEEGGGGTDLISPLPRLRYMITRRRIAWVAKFSKDRDPTLR